MAGVGESGLARILAKVEELGVWPEGLLDAYVAMILEVGGDSTPLGQRPLCVLPVVYRVWASARMGQLEGWFRSWVPGSVDSAGCGRGSVEAWYTTALDIEEVLAGAVDSHVHVFVADVVKSCDTVNRGISDQVLSSLGLPAWFRHTYFEHHAHVRLQFKLAAGLGEPWTRDRVYSSRLSFEHDVYCCFVPPLVQGILVHSVVSRLRSMLITSSVCAGIRVCFCVLLGLPLGMSGWLARNRLPVKASCLVRLKSYGMRCVAGSCLMRVTSGLSSWMSETWVGILILLGGAGLPLCQLVFVLLFLASF